MISKRKSYSYNKQTLRFEEVVLPLKNRIIKALRFFFFASLISGFLLFLMSLTIGTPSEIILKQQISGFSNEFSQINYKIDNIHNHLLYKTFKSDKYYRELLEVDSMPSQIRNAGMGGSKPSHSLFSTPFEPLIDSTFKKIESLKIQLQIQNNSFKVLSEKAENLQKELNYIPAIPPVNPLPQISISSGFGNRFDPFNFLTKAHEGIDFVGPLNTEIYATADGIVTFADDSRSGYGKEIVLLHDFGYCSLYAHLNKILVTSGQKVTRGDLIGQMGSTGRSTGTHLHYEVRLYNRPINPINYFADNLSAQDYELIINRNQ